MKIFTFALLPNYRILQTRKIQNLKSKIRLALINAEFQTARVALFAADAQKFHISLAVFRRHILDARADQVTCRRDVFPDLLVSLPDDFHRNFPVW